MLENPCRMTGLERARMRSVASAGGFYWVRGSKAPSSWRDEGPLSQGGLARWDAASGDDLCGVNTSRVDLVKPRLRCEGAG